MASVILVREDWHGFLTVAKDAPSAIHYLVAENWINEKSYVYPKERLVAVKLIDYYGDNWYARLKGESLEKLSELFEEVFYFDEWEVYSIE